MHIAAGIYQAYMLDLGQKKEYALAEAYRISSWLKLVKGDTNVASQKI